LERENPIVTSMMFADTAYSILNRVSRVLTWSIIISSFVIALVALYVTRSFLPIYTLRWGITIPMGVAVFVVLAPLTVYYGLIAKRMLKAWVQKFATFSYMVRFETSHRKGKNPQEQLVNQILESVPELGAPFKKFIEENPSSLKDFLDVKIHGVEETFDVCIRREQIKVKGDAADHLRRALNKHGIVLVKRLDKKDPVDESDLMEIRSRLLQALEIDTALPFMRTKINRILIVSTSSFTESASKFAAERKNRLGGKSFDLVEEGPKGYLVVSAVT